MTTRQRSLTNDAPLVSGASEPPAPIREALPIFRNDFGLRQLSRASDQVVFFSCLCRTHTSCCARLYKAVVAAFDARMILVARDQKDGVRVAIRKQSLADNLTTIVVPVNDQSGRTQLWTVSYPAGQMRRLTNDLADYDRDIDTTRDGRMLATVQHMTISNVSVSSARDGSGAKQLTSGEQLVSYVFPVGEKIAFVNRVDNHVWTMEANGAHAKVAADAVGGSWFTACGRSILFVAERNGTNELTRTDEDGANPKVLATGFIWGETCSPDAKFVYYPEMLKPRWKIRRVPIDGGAPADIVENPGLVIPGRVAISPNGRLLAFPYNVASPEPTLKIGVVSIASGTLAKVLDVPNDLARLCWSPDGRNLQYLLDKNRQTTCGSSPWRADHAASLRNLLRVESLTSIGPLTENNCCSLGAK